MKKNLLYLGFTICALALTMNSFAQDPSADLSHSWTFENDLPNDVVGKAHGTLVGSAYIENQTLITEEAGSYVELPGDKIAINEYSEVSLEAWVTPSASANTGYTMICYFGGSVNDLGSNGYFISIARGDDKSRTALSCGDEATPWASETGVDGAEYDDGAIHHFVSTLNASEISYYIDGAFIGTTPLAGANTIGGLSANFAFLCKGGYTNDPTWLGKIHKVSMYKKALTAENVTFLYSKNPTKTAVNNITDNSFKPAIYAAKNQLNVSIANTKAQSGSFQVYNLMGAKVSETKHFEGSTSVSLSQGIYVVKVQAGSKSYVQKVAVQ